MRPASQSNSATLFKFTLAIAISFVAACGVRDNGNGEQAVVLPAPAATASVLMTAVPSTTTPVPLTRDDCVGGPIETTERLLIERRRGQAFAGCDTGLELRDLEVCWSQCDDARVFVDFDLDASHPAQPYKRGITGEVVAVEFAARYATGPGTVTAAETLLLSRTEPSSAWRVVDLIASDTTRQEAAAMTAMEKFIAALRTQDYTAAADMIRPASTVVGRDDLGRLADEGFLDGTSITDIAVALKRWCQSGAECGESPAIEIEITATHSMRAIATYELALGTFETSLLVDDNLIVGLPIRTQ